MKSLKRFLEIISGSALILVGIIMTVTPGPAVVSILAGIFLISPYHGRRAVWRLGKIWKKVKMWWFSWRFKRTIKRKIVMKAEKLKRKISCKK